MADDASPQSPSANAVAVRPAKVYTTVEAAVGMMDTARFEHLGRVANVLAMANLLPKSLTHIKDEPLPFPVVQARAYAIVGQAELWNADPLAVAQCTSLVHGKLCYEGKLIHGLIEARAGVRLRYEFGRYDKKLRDIVVGEEVGELDRNFGVRVSARFPDEDFYRWIAGSVEMWHTGDKGPWQHAVNWPRQCRYRGAREWARAHQPHLVLGILTDDEVEDFNELALQRATERAARGEKPNLRGRLKGPKEGDEGFSAEHVDAETGGRVIDTTATVVEAELKVGGEKAARDAEADAGNASAARSAGEASATSDSATPASTASQAQTDPSPQGSSNAPAAGSEAAAREDREAAPAKNKGGRPRKDAAPPAPPAEPELEEADPIGDFIDSLAGMDKWAEQLKAEWFVFKKSQAYKDASEERRREASVALVERVFELNDQGALDLQPHQDPTFFNAWCSFMLERGPRPAGAQSIAKELAALRETPAFKALTDGARQGLEGYANSVIGVVGDGILG